jgi:predicted HD superfamily hydrolase involved in NAD metabolism
MIQVTLTKEILTNKGRINLNPSYQQYVKGIIFTQDLRQDIESLFLKNKEQSTLEHTIIVAREATRIALLFDADPLLAEQAALLHDISNVIPIAEMMSLAEELHIGILEDERQYPRIVHQKLSMDMSREVFKMTNADVLNAIECHTTLRSGASKLTKILFVADKISWELPGEHPYQGLMRERILSSDLDGAVLVYLNHVWGQRENLKLLHPWLIEAREELMNLN